MRSTTGFTDRAPLPTGRRPAPLALAVLALLMTLAACAPAASSGPPATSPSLAAPPTLGPGELGDANRALPQYAGDVLHYTKLVYKRSPEATTTLAPGETMLGGDPSNGADILADVWVLMGTNGLPSVYNVRYTLPGGALSHQDYGSQTDSITVMGRTFAPPVPTAPGSLPQFPCRQLNPAPKARQFAVLAPPFTQNALMTSGEGFTMTSGAPTQPPPITPALPGVTPLATLASPATVSIWTKDMPTTAGLDHLRVESDASGRVIYQEDNIVTAQGQPVVDVWQTYGPVDVYAATAVPPSVFTPPTAPVVC